MKLMKHKIILITAILVALASYFLLRAKVIENMNHHTDHIFSKLVDGNHESIRKHLNLINQNLDDAYAIIENHQAAITNFNYKNSKPNLNLMLNQADIEVSWHLTILFHKKNGIWYISKLDEFEEI